MFEHEGLIITSRLSERPIEDVEQLAYVPGPRVPQQGEQEAERWAMIPAPVADEKEDVLLPGRKRRDPDRVLADPAEQILPEPPLIDSPFQVLVGREDEPYVWPDRGALTGRQGD